MEKDDSSLAVKPSEKLNEYFQRIGFNFDKENSFSASIDDTTTDMNNHHSIPFDRLKGRENYSVWKTGAKAHLIIKGLWSCCQTALADTASAADKKDDQKAIAEITLLLEPSNYTYIESAKTAKEAWDGITAAFDDTGTGRKVLLLQQMVSLKMEQCSSMEEYVNKMNTLWSKVKHAGFKIDDEVAGSLMLVGLPAKYTPTIVSLESAPDAITFDKVKNLLLQGLVFDDGSDDIRETALAVNYRHKYNNKQNQQKSVKLCYGCESESHFIRDCPKANGKNKNRNSGKNSNNKSKKESALFTSFIVDESEPPNKRDWYVDSGATGTMSNNISIINNQVKIDRKEVTVANNDKMTIDCVGSVNQKIVVEGRRKEIEISNVHHVPNICANLLSVSQMVKKNHTVIFNRDGCRIFDSDWDLLATASLVND